MAAACPTPSPPPAPQCGRFHELAAFAPTMRSCRKQLAKHAERRRRARELAARAISEAAAATAGGGAGQQRGTQQPLAPDSSREGDEASKGVGTRAGALPRSCQRLRPGSLPPERPSASRHPHLLPVLSRPPAGPSDSHIQDLSQGQPAGLLPPAKRSRLGEEPQQQQQQQHQVLMPLPVGRLPELSPGLLPPAWCLNESGGSAISTAMHQSLQSLQESGLDALLAAAAGEGGGEAEAPPHRPEPLQQLPVGIPGSAAVLPAASTAAPLAPVPSFWLPPPPSRLATAPSAPLPAVSVPSPPLPLQPGQQPGDWLQQLLLQQPRHQPSTAGLLSPAHQRWPAAPPPAFLQHAVPPPQQQVPDVAAFAAALLQATAQLGQQQQQQQLQQQQQQQQQLGLQALQQVLAPPQQQQLQQQQQLDLQTLQQLLLPPQQPRASPAPPALLQSVPLLQQPAPQEQQVTAMFEAAIGVLLHGILSTQPPSGESGGHAARLPCRLLPTLPSHAPPPCPCRACLSRPLLQQLAPALPLASSCCVFSGCSSACPSKSF